MRLVCVSCLFAFSFLAKVAANKDAPWTQITEMITRITDYVY